MAVFVGWKPGKRLEQPLDILVQRSIPTMGQELIPVLD